jgi:hypothetical protein
MKKIKLLFASLALVLCLLPVATASAEIYNPFGDICKGGLPKTQSAVCQADGGDPITGKNGIIYKTSRILATVAAIGAVVMIMVGGFTYVTSAGDANRAGSGKRMIIGAVVGLAVIGLAEMFVAIVINLVT